MPEYDFKTFFLLEFSKELIKNSKKIEISSQKLLKERVKERIEKRLKET